MIDTNDTSLAFVNKMFKYMKNGMSIETFMNKFNLSNAEVKGIVELCKLYQIILAFSSALIKFYKKIE